MGFDIFTPKAPPLFGLDISSSAIKVVELSMSGKAGLRLERYAIEPLPRETMVDNAVGNHDALVEAIKRAMRKLGSRTKHVAMALPASMVITKKVVVPGDLREDAMDMQVQANIKDQIPYEIDVVNIDWQILGPNKHNAEELDVFVAAAKKELIEDRVAAVEGAGLRARVMDYEPFAVLRSLNSALRREQAEVADQNIALIDIGSTVTSASVFRNGEIVYSRDQGFGGNQLTHEISRTYTMPFDEAERIKLGRGKVPDDYRTEVLKPFLESAAEEVRRILQMFTTSTSYTSVDRLYLAGGVSALPGMAASVEQHCHLENVSLFDPFRGIAHGSAIDADRLEADAPALTLACGLALRRFDK